MIPHRYITANSTVHGIPVTQGEVNPENTLSVFIPSYDFSDRPIKPIKNPTSRLWHLPLEILTIIGCYLTEEKAEEAFKYTCKKFRKISFRSAIALERIDMRHLTYFSVIKFFIPKVIKEIENFLLISTIDKKFVWEMRGYDAPPHIDRKPLLQMRKAFNGCVNRLKVNISCKGIQEIKGLIAAHFLRQLKRLHSDNADPRLLTSFYSIFNGIFREMPKKDSEKK